MPFFYEFLTLITNYSRCRLKSRFTLFGCYSAPLMIEVLLDEDYYFDQNENKNNLTHIFVACSCKVRTDTSAKFFFFKYVAFIKRIQIFTGNHVQKTVSLVVSCVANNNFF